MCQSATDGYSILNFANMYEIELQKYFEIQGVHNIIPSTRLTRLKTLKF